jgi:hypothetical protein
MNDQLERELLDTFDRRAGAPVDASTLALVTAERGRRLRTRVYAVRAVSGLVALAVLGAAGVLGVRAVRPGALPAGGPPSSTPGAGDEGPPPGGWKVPGLPIARGVPGAEQSPEKVGTDAGVLHFTVDGMTGSRAVTWSSRAGSESIFDGAWEVTLARTTAPLDALRNWRTAGTGDPYVTGAVPPNKPQPEPDRLTPSSVGGKPATIYSWESPDAGNGTFYLRWQPVAGLWAQVFGSRGVGVPDDAIAVAERVRLDTAYRCASQVRLPHLPDGAKLQQCEVTLAGAELSNLMGDPTRLSHSLLLVGDGPNVIRLDVQHLTSGSGSRTDETEIELGGRKAYKFPNHLDQPVVEVRGLNGLNLVFEGSGAYDYEELEPVAAAVTVTGDGRDPSTWPDRIIG